MKRKGLLLCILIYCSIGLSQSCLPDGIVFTTQKQIDNFQADYPYCSEIEGDVAIYGDEIENIEGLLVIEQIHGDLFLGECYSLGNLHGFYNLCCIGGSLFLSSCDSIQNYTGLDNLTAIEGDLIISGQYWNPNKVNSLEALQNLQSVGGKLEISWCNSITNLNGIENIDYHSISELYIHENELLNSCEVESISDYLANPNGSINIYNNAPGCNNPTEVATACGITLNNLPFGNYYFTKQEDIDNFQIYFPGCSNVTGDILIVKSTNINNLNGLNIIQSIEGNLIIGFWLGGNLSLTNLSGLSNLNYVGGDLAIRANTILTNISGLNNIVFVGGNIEIGNNNKLNNIESFTNLISVDGDIYFLGNNELISIDCFNNVTDIGGTLSFESNCNLESICFQNLSNTIGGIKISHNNSLSNIQGFDLIDSINNELYLSHTKLHNLSVFAGLQFIGNNLVIEMNDSLENLFGLNNLISVNKDLMITENDILVNLSGLNQLNIVGGSLSINNNMSLNSIEDLLNTNVISGSLTIDNNDSLKSLYGLDNLVPDSISNLTITNNYSLKTCDVNAICGYLSVPNGSVNVYNNAFGCNTPPEIAVSCNIILPCLPYGNYYFFNQSEVDNFHNNYPNCTELSGNTVINGDDIYKLDSLSEITYIDGNLIINGCHLLENLSGFRDLIEIGGSCKISSNFNLIEINDLNSLEKIGNNLEIYQNTDLNTINGFAQLNTVYGALTITSNHWVKNLNSFENLSFIGGNLTVKNNNMLNSLTGFSNLLKINGNLDITDNDSLKSLSGLDNIDNNTIENLTVASNSTLYDCDIASICAYLLSPGGTILISNNSIGCNNESEVQWECLTDEPEKIENNEVFTVYPNPACEYISVISTDNLQILNIEIINYYGQTVLKTNNSYNYINVSNLSKGIYEIVIETHNRLYIRKIIIY